MANSFVATVHTRTHVHLQRHWHVGLLCDEENQARRAACILRQSQPQTAICSRETSSATCRTRRPSDTCCKQAKRTPCKWRTHALEKDARGLRILSIFRRYAGHAFPPANVAIIANDTRYTVMQLTARQLTIQSWTATKTRCSGSVKAKIKER